MNLVTDPWIPVITDDGTPEVVGLSDLFNRADRIQDLSAHPPRRVALMRLLICVAQAALDGPEDLEDWYYCRDRIPEAAQRYLDHWRPAFDLHGRTPFMQVPDLKVDDGHDRPLDGLDPRLASGNNATLFDQGASPAGRWFNEGETALNLLTALNFSAGGKVGQAKWAGVKYSDSTFAAPCIKNAHTFILGRNLLETVHLNLLSKADDTNGINLLPNLSWGRPVWERFPKSAGDTDAFNNAAATYLGRLVPLSRLVRLRDPTAARPRCIFGPTPKAFVIEHLPAFREPWLTVITDKTGNDRYLPLSSDQHIWRQLGAVLSLRRTVHGTGGALPLSALAFLYDQFPETTVDIWVGGLETGAQAGKISDMLEWRFQFPVAQLRESRLEKYGAGVALADRAEQQLKAAVKTYFTTLRVPPRAIPTGPARRAYWEALDRQYGVLVEAANDPMVPLSRRWYPVVREAMESAYAAACPHVSPRQIQAFARGRAELRLKKPDAPAPAPSQPDTLEESP